LLEKYRSYEEMAGWSASRFHPAGMKTSDQKPRVVDAAAT
jgi:hypothetical protein